MVIDILAADDSRVDDFRDLNSIDRRPDRTTGDGPGLVIAEGVNVARRMIASRFIPHAFLGVEKRRQELENDLRRLPEVPFYRVGADVMAEVVGFHLNRGVLAVARRPAPLSLADVIAAARTVVICEGVNDHENIGSIFRNSAGLGVDAVIFAPGCADPLYRRSVRVSMGHALRVPYAQVAAAQWPQTTLEVLRSNGFRTVALTPGETAVPLAHAAAGPKVAFIVGAEGPGLAARTLQAVDVRARIEMTRDTDSLNVATAAAIACYERARSVPPLASPLAAGEPPIAFQAGE